MIRVVLAEDHCLVREGLRTLLSMSGEVEVVAEAADGIECLAALGAGEVDLLILDLRMPRAGGLDVLRALAGLPSAPRVLMLTTFDDEDELREALELGARGYLLKDASLDELLAAIRTVQAGGLVVRTTPAAAVAAARAGSGPPAWPPAEPLSPREADVLRLMAGGLSNREIAVALLLAEGTVKNHVSVILAKLGVRDRVRAVLRAIENGLV
ncbi:MAG TPA: response regulator transcription factor [Kofleriaceae bacterium]|nr:response regulator transcription factor [Kofleriaceae bacterium]